MTLEAYDPEQLDQLALRTLDLAAELRGMANLCRKSDISACPLHDKKALEWLDKLEDWTRKTSSRLELLTVRQRAVARAHALPARTPESLAPGKQKRQ